MEVEMYGRLAWLSFPRQPGPDVLVFIPLSPRDLQTMIFTTAFCAAGLLLCQRMSWPLLAVWAAIKLLTVGRLLGNSWFLFRHPASPLQLAKPQPA